MISKVSSCIIECDAMKSQNHGKRMISYIDCNVKIQILIYLSDFFSKAIHIRMTGDLSIIYFHVMESDSK